MAYVTTRLCPPQSVICDVLHALLEGNLIGTTILYLHSLSAPIITYTAQPQPHKTKLREVVSGVRDGRPPQ